MNIEIRNPDIGHLAKIGKKYIHILKQNDQEVLEILAQWNNIIKSLSDVYQEELFSTKEMYENFLNDCETNSFRALCIGWSIGYEFSSVYPDNSKFILIIENYNSDLLPIETKNELLDIADHGLSIFLLFLSHANKRHLLDDVDFISSIETLKKIYREGVLLALKDGVLRNIQDSSKKQ